MKRLTTAFAVLGIAAAAGLAGLAPRASAPAINPAAADTWTIDTVHSALVFKVKHLKVSTFYGRFNTFSGSFAFDEANPSASTLSVEVATDSVDTANANRDKHLKSPDFFNAAVNPKASFTSTSIAKGDHTWAVTGDLTINGVTRSVTCEFTHGGTDEFPRFGKRAGIHGEVTINRQDFNIKYMPELLGDEVTLIIALEGTRQ